jgi:hypothetical protein
MDTLASARELEDACELEPVYEPPLLRELGLVADRTLHGCYWNKQWGGSDGFTFMGISVPISNCSS